MGLLEHLDAETRRWWKFRVHHRNHAAHIPIRLSQRHARFDSGESLIIEASQENLAAVELKREDQIGLLIHEPEALRHDPDDLPGFPANEDSPSDHRSVSAESSLPIRIRQHHRIRAARSIVFLREGAPQERLHAKRRQCLVGHRQTLYLFRLGQPCNADGAAIPQSEFLERPIFFAERKIVRRRSIEFLNAEVWSLLPDPDELFGVWIRKRL